MGDVREPYDYLASIIPAYDKIYKLKKEIQKAGSFKSIHASWLKLLFRHHLAVYIYSGVSNVYPP